jgi:alpha-galactosidase
MEVDGAWLNHMGLPLPPMKGEEVLVHDLTVI